MAQGPFGQLLKALGIRLSSQVNINAPVGAAHWHNASRVLSSTAALKNQSNTSAEASLHCNLHNDRSFPESPRFWPASRCGSVPWLQDRSRQAHSASIPQKGDDQQILLSQSHVIGPTNIPLLETTIGQKFTETAANFSNHVALISKQENVCYTYEELLKRVTALASGLARLGLTRGDRLGLFSPNHAAWVVTQFAAAKLGLILVNLNPGYQSLELHQTVRKVGCRALVVADKYKGKSMIETCERALKWDTRGGTGRVRSEEVPSLEHILTLGEQGAPGLLGLNDVMDLATTADEEALKRVEASNDPDDVINIQFTSGTTGRPKGACLTHRNILNNGFLVGRRILLSDADKICIPVPFYHCFGMVMGNLAAITHGATMVIPSPEFDPLATLQAVHRERCTALYGVPTMFVAELHHPAFPRFDLSSLRTGIMAGSPCPVNVMRRVMTDMHMRQVTICYGMTETSPVSFQTTVDDPVEKRLETVGRIQPHTEAKVVDPETREVLPVNTPGELVVRGYLTMKSYWDEPEKTREVKDDEGWVSTGDLAAFDERGYCSITGRIKDMVIRGGQNLFPKEIEDVIHTHPGVEDVHIIGVPDSYYGEELCAWVKVKEGQKSTPDDITSHCRERIARYKVPRYVKFVDAFPMTVTGKVQKYKMREVSARELRAEALGSKD
ncbi:Long chain fatty acid acyl-CoA ligase [Klebsormidium nitens]|uniref:Long chain fatty acid acyl-CoA ligase n=1 Tax=Klebsormidium nitens TaxID=105231 RepID=A0A1Y1INZ1_KLENI|nr:Long chain fatty acid acyl-CoA ligase [Klebsormidium nitens]|eukprot:GAQ90891.1 Long chain fatty acid acyl-CoA ligase [Klebsormidium nitens]